jgi:hypothetical protein
MEELGFIGGNVADTDADIAVAHRSVLNRSLRMLARKVNLISRRILRCFL